MWACLLCIVHYLLSYVCIWIMQRVHMCDVTHAYVLYDSFTCVTWPIHPSDMTRLVRRCDEIFFQKNVCGRTFDSNIYIQIYISIYVRWDSFICVTGLFHMCDVPILVNMRGEIYFLRFFLMCGVAHMCSETLPDVWQDSFISVIWHYSLVCVARFIEIYVDVWHCTYVRRHSFTRWTW